MKKREKISAGGGTGGGDGASANAPKPSDKPTPAKEPVERFCVSLSPQLLGAFDEFLAFKEQGRSECVRELIRHALLAQSWGANSHDFCAAHARENGENPAQNGENGGEITAPSLRASAKQGAWQSTQAPAQFLLNSNLTCEDGEGVQTHAHGGQSHAHGGQTHAHFHAHGDENHFHNHAHSHENHAHYHAHDHAENHAHDRAENHANAHAHDHNHAHENHAHTPAPREFVAVFACVFDHHQNDLLARKTAIEHAAHIQIVCTTHIHIDCHNCLETSVLKSLDAREIEGFCRKIGALKGVKFSNLARVAVWDF